MYVVLLCSEAELLKGFRGSFSSERGDFFIVTLMYVVLLCSEAVLEDPFRLNKVPSP